MARRFPGVPPPPPPPGSPAAAVLVGGRMPPPSAAARQTGFRPRCATRNYPCATEPPVAVPAPPHCWWAPRPPRGQRSTAPATTFATAGTAPPLYGPGYPGHAGAAAPAAPGAG